MNASKNTFNQTFHINANRFNNEANREFSPLRS